MFLYARSFSERRVSAPYTGLIPISKISKFEVCLFTFFMKSLYMASYALTLSVFHSESLCRRIDGRTFPATNTLRGKVPRWVSTVLAFAERELRRIDLPVVINVEVVV